MGKPSESVAQSGSDPAWGFHYEMRVFHQAMQIPGQIIATQAFRQLRQGPLTILIPVNESLAFGADEGLPCSIAGYTDRPCTT